MPVSSTTVLIAIRTGICSFFLLLAVSGNAQPAQEPAAAPAAEQAAAEPTKESAQDPAKTAADNTTAIPSNDQLLAEQVPADQIWWLTANNDKFLGLYIAEATGRDGLGAVLILPDPGRPADWPAISRTLRELLPKHRWSTLAINPSTSNATLQARIEAAIKQLRSKNLNNIAIIAEGKTSLGALEYIQLHAGQVSAVVLLNPAHEALLETDSDKAPAVMDDKEKTAAEPIKTETPKTENTASDKTDGKLDELLARIGMLAVPCLDMAIDSSAEGMTLAAERLDASRKLKPGQYQQVSLPPNDRFGINNQESPVSKRIRGWLGKNANNPVK